MPLNRTPPISDSPSTSAFKTPLQHYASDPNIAQSPLQEAKVGPALSFPNIASRHRKNKRTREDTDDISKSDFLNFFTSFKEDQDAKFSTILSSINDLKVSMDHMSQKYDAVLTRLDFLEEERKTYNSNIKVLEDKLENLERHSKITSIELRNIPQAEKETKQDLKNIVFEVAKILNVPIQSSDIKDVYRINTKANAKRIIADFTTVFSKDNILKSFNKYNKEHPIEKLSTKSLGIGGPNNLVYISVNLTQRDRKLYYLAREFIKSSDYSYCWLSFGRIFVRKSEGSPQIRITSESDIDNLKIN